MERGRLQFTTKEQTQIHAELESRFELNLASAE